MYDPIYVSISGITDGFQVPNADTYSWCQQVLHQLECLGIFRVQTLFMSDPHCES